MIFACGFFCLVKFADLVLKAMERFGCRFLRNDKNVKNHALNLLTPD